MCSSLRACAAVSAASRSALSASCLFAVLFAVIAPAGCTNSTTGGGGGSLGTPAANDLTWSKTYGGPGLDRATVMVESPHNGYLVAGLTDGFEDGSTDIWAFRVDAAGDSVWSRTLGANGLRLDEVRWVASDSASTDLFLVGVETVGNGIEGVAVRLTSDLRVRWRRILPFTEPEHVLPLPGGDCIVAGSTFDGGQIAVARLDGEGRRRWDFAFSAGRAYVSELAPSGLIYLGGAIRTEPEVEQPFVSALDADGGIVWTQSDHDPEEGRMAVRAIEVTDLDGAYVATGTWILGDPEEIGNRVFRQLGDEQGALDDHDEIPGAGTIPPAGISWNWLERLADGTYAATGGAYAEGEPAVPIAGHFDAELAMISTEGIDFPEPDEDGAGTRIAERSDGRWVVLGEISGITQNIFYAEFGALDEIVHQGITGAGTGGGVGQDRVLGAAFVAAGGLCLVGQTTAGPNGTGAWISLLGPDYEESSEQYRKLDTIDDLRGGVANHAGDGFVLLGTSAVTAFASPDSPAIFVLEIDEDGLVVWERALRTDSGFVESGVGICAHGDGYAVIGQSGPGIVVIALDAAGEIVAETRHGPPPISDLRLVAGGISPAPGGDLFIAGTLVDPASEGGPEPLWIARLGPDLAQAWRSEILAPLDMKGFVLHPDFRVVGVQALDAGCAVLSSTTIFDEPAIHLLAVDDTGAPLWSNIYGGGVEIDEPAALARGAEPGTLTIAATTRSFGGGQMCDGVSRCPNLAAIRVHETDGSIDGQWTYSTATTDIAHAVGVSPSGDFFLAGETDGVLGNPDFWALRIAKDGIISTECPGGIGVAAGFVALDLDIEAIGVTANESGHSAADLGAETAAIGRSDYEETRQCTGEGTDPDPIEFAVLIEITGAGSVDSSTGDSCSSSCEFLVPAGTMLALTPVPAAGAAFIGFGGDYAGSPVEVTADLVITAAFGEPCGSGLATFEIGEWLEAWDDTEFAIVGNAFTASMRQPNGGDPGAYRETYFALLGGSSISVGHFAPGLTVDPSASGPLQSIGYSVCVAQTTPLPAGSSVVFRLAVRQGGTIYIATTASAPIGSAAWTPSGAAGLLAADFSSSTGAHPAFGAGGAPVDLGYVLSGASPVSMNHLVGVDNLVISVDGFCP